MNQNDFYRYQMINNLYETAMQALAGARQFLNTINNQNNKIIDPKRLATKAQYTKLVEYLEKKTELLNQEKKNIEYVTLMSLKDLDKQYDENTVKGSIKD